MMKMFLQLIFVSFVLLPCAYAIKCVTGLTESSPTDADDKLISVECPSSFAFCERRNWLSDQGASVIFTRCANAESCAEPCLSLPPHIISDIDPKLHPGVFARITCVRQCCNVDNCNNPFPDGGDQVNSTRLTTQSTTSTITLIFTTGEGSTTIDSELSGETSTTTVLATTEEGRTTIDPEFSGETATITLLATTEGDRTTIDSELSGETAKITVAATTEEDRENIDLA